MLTYLTKVHVRYYVNYKGEGVCPGYFSFVTLQDNL